VEQIKEMQVYF